MIEKTVHICKVWNFCCLSLLWITDSPFVVLPVVPHILVVFLFWLQTTDALLFFGPDQEFHFYWNPEIKDRFIRVRELEPVLRNFTLHWVCYAIALCIQSQETGPMHTEAFFPESVWYAGTTSTLWISLLMAKSICTTCVFIKINLKWILLDKRKRESGVGSSK